MKTKLKKNLPLIAVAALALVMVVVGYVALREPNRPPSEPFVAGPTRTPAPSRRYTVTPAAVPAFAEVRNDCGLCGTNSPVGGWETEDGRALILSADGDFTAIFADGATIAGTWSQTAGKLCLESATGSQTCYSYRQRVDAMKLDDAIYIRR